MTHATHELSPQEKRKERREIDQRLPLRAAATYEVVRKQGEEELERRAQALWWSGMAAGFSISLSMVGMGIIKAALPDASWTWAVMSLGYTIGFVIVIMARQQLFTETTLTALLPVLAEHSRSDWFQMLRLWGIVLSANLAGAILFAMFAMWTPVFSEAHHAAFMGIGEHLMENSALEMGVKGIVSGWLIATLVWVLPRMEDEKFWMIILITWLISAGGFTHIIAGTTEAAYYAMAGGTDWMSVIFRFALPTLVGNIIGGSTLFALISYAQVREEIEDMNGT